MSTTSVEPATPTSYVPSRRTVLRAAAWTAPAVSVAVAVPAYAAASGPAACADAAFEIRWDTHYNPQSRTAVVSPLRAVGAGTLGTASLVMTVSSKFHGGIEAGSASDGTSNLTVSPFTVGGLGERGLTIMQRAKQGVSELPTPRSAQCQVVTFAFSRPVKDLEFTLTDIDSAAEPAYEERYFDVRTWSWKTRWVTPDGQYQDRVSVSGSPAGTRASQVVGSGATGDAWRSSSTNIQHDPKTGRNGNVTVKYTGQPAAQAHTLTYWNDQAGPLLNRGLQGVFISNLTFTASSCA